MLLAVVLISQLRLSCKCKTFRRCCWWSSVTHHIATVHYKQEYELMNGIMGKRCTRYFYYLCKYWIVIFIYFSHSITSLPRKYFLWRYFQNLLHLLLLRNCVCVWLSQITNIRIYGTDREYCLNNSTVITNIKCLLRSNMLILSKRIYTNS